MTATGWASKEDLVRIAAEFHAFEESEAAAFDLHEAPLLRESREFEPFIEKYRAVISQRVRVSQEIYELLNGFFEPLDPSVLNEFLARLFASRADTLMEREASYSQYLSDLRISTRRGNVTALREIFIPSDPVQAKGTLFSDDPNGRSNQRIAVANTNFYQTSNRLIVAFLQELGPDQLSSANQTWLRASVSLHRLLSGESDDWGHSDQATLGEGCDLQLYTYFVFSRKAEERRRIGLDVEVVRYRTLTFSEMAAEGGEGVRAKMLKTLGLSPSFPRELPRVAWLGDELPVVRVSTGSRKRKPRRQRRQPLASAAAAAGGGLGEEEVGVAAETEEALFAGSSEIAAMAVPVAAAEGGAVAVDECLERGAAPGGIALVEGPERLDVEIDPVAATTVDVSPAVHSRPAVRGVRVCHPLAPVNRDAVAVTNLASLRKGEREWLRDLLTDPEKTYNYDSFSRVWSRLGGSMQSSPSGGSHIRLLNTEGKTVGGIFAHGRGQSYGRQYTPYLQAAFTHGLNRCRRFIEIA